MASVTGLRLGFGLGVDLHRYIHLQIYSVGSRAEFGFVNL